MGVHMVADPDQALGLAVVRMIREGLHLARPVHAHAPRSGVSRAPLAQWFHEQRGCRGRAERMRSRRWRDDPGNAGCGIRQLRP